MEKTGEFDLLPKKEVIKLKLERDKLEKNLGGIKDMTKLPGIIFVVDSKKEHICVKEAKALNIPTVGLIDTNCDPENITHVIPGNDDAIRSVKLIAAAMANAVIEAKEGVQLTVELPELEGDKAESNIEDIEKVFEENKEEKVEEVEEIKTTKKAKKEVDA